MKTWERGMTGIFLVILFFTAALRAQDTGQVISQIFEEALVSRVAYGNLEHLCKNTAGRVTGSESAAEAVEYTRRLMLALEPDTVYLQEVMVPRWVRGREEVQLVSSVVGSFPLKACALGLSGSTGPGGLAGSVIEVQGIDELKSLGHEQIKGKIVFFNRRMDPAQPNTFAAYGRVVDQRVSGPSAASSLGAKAAVVRSVTTAMDDVPHTGVTRFDEGTDPIPALSLSPLAADLLSSGLKEDPSLTLHIINTCITQPDVLSYNVVGEVRGSRLPGQIITVGGHLDAWDTGEGAHDDGAGCIQSIEVLRLFRELKIDLKRTLRIVMFMDEEIAQRGSARYFELAKENNEDHYAALESDRGALVPRGFGFSAQGERLEKLQMLAEYFRDYGITDFRSGGGGPDIAPLAAFGALLINYIPDAQRYFDFHHSANDSFEQVHPRELQLGSAAMAAIIYLVDLFDL